MDTPILVLENAIYSRLSGDTALITLLGSSMAVFNSVAESIDPFVRFSWQAGGEDNFTPNRSRSPVYVVIAQSEDRQLALQLSDAIETALETLPAMAGWRHLRTLRLDDISFVVNQQTARPLHTVGALYKFLIEKE